MDPAVERQLAGAQRRFLLPWLGAAGAPLVLAAIGYALAGGFAPGDDPLPTLPKAMTAAGLVWCGLVLFLRRQVLSPAGLAARLPAPDAAAVVRHMLAGYLVLWSAAIVPSIIGIAQVLAGGDARMHLLLCGASVWVLAYLMPARSRLAALAEAALSAWRQLRPVSGG